MQCRFLRLLTRVLFRDGILRNEIPRDRIPQNGITRDRIPPDDIPRDGITRDGIPPEIDPTY